MLVDATQPKRPMFCQVASSKNNNKLKKKPQLFTIQSLPWKKRQKFTTKMLVDRILTSLPNQIPFPNVPYLMRKAETWGLMVKSKVEESYFTFL